MPTYGRDHRDGEIEGACEVPLQTGFVRLQEQNHVLQFFEVRRGQVEPVAEVLLARAQIFALARLLLGFQRIEDRGTNDQVGQGAEDEDEGPQVLPLHGGAGVRQGRKGRVSAALRDAQLGLLMALLV